MNKKLMTALRTPTAFALLTFGVLSAGTLASASTITTSVHVDSGAGAGPLYVGNGSQIIYLPLSAVGGTVPGDLSLSAANLPEGVSVTLTGARQDGDTVALAVSTQSADSEATTGPVDALANVALISGGQTLTVFQVPVQSADDGFTPRVSALSDN